MRGNKHSKRILTVPTLYGSHRIIVEPDEKNGFIVTAPDLPGVITWGKSIAHAKEMAREAIELCVECLVEEATARSGGVSDGAPATEERLAATRRAPARIKAMAV